jgi:hypothetical protein
MEQKCISYDELEELKKEVEGVKSTITILQDKEMMDEIKTSEELEKKEVPLEKIEF